MKLNKVLSVVALSLISLFAACDKIESENYLVFSGASGEWYDGNGVADKSQRAFLDKFTGIRCVNCPTADEAIHAAMEQYGDKLIAVAIHDSSTFGMPVEGFDLRTEDGNTWRNTLRGAGGLPAALVMRDGDIFTPTSGIQAKVDPILAQSPVVAISVESQLSDRTANIGINLEFLQTCNDNLNLTVFIMEDGIIGQQFQPDGSHKSDYVHNHVLRDVITDVWGAEVDADGQAGTKRFCNIKHTIEQNNWNLSNCKVVAFISNRSTKAILNVAECEL